jgi:uncharacterized protein CbrC (UPF0167 family)
MMPKEQLPEFKYFKDPLGVGVFKESDQVCLCCSQARGYKYTGPFNADEELYEQLCPWCIADGSAALRFSATFIDELGIGGYGRWESVPEQVNEEIMCRTPCFTAWQPEQWWTHCGDAAAYIDCAGKDELLVYGSDLIQRLKDDVGIEDDQWDHVFHAMQKDGSVRAYIFQCRHCGEFGGYWDCM